MWGWGAFTERVFCKCQELRVDGFINPLSLQNTWGGGEVEESGGKEEGNISGREERKEEDGMEER